MCLFKRNSAFKRDRGGKRDILRLRKENEWELSLQNQKSRKASSFTQTKEVAGTRRIKRERFTASLFPVFIPDFQQLGSCSSPRRELYWSFVIWRKKMSGLGDNRNKDRGTY